MQTLLRADARKIAHREFGLRLFARQPIMARKIDSQRHDVNSFRRQPEIISHEVTVVGAMREKTVELPRMLADQVERLRAMGFDEIFEKDIVPLQQAEH